MIAHYIFRKLSLIYDDIQEYKKQQRMPTKLDMLNKEARVMSLDFYLVDVPYELKSKPYYIHTFIGKLDQTKPNLVLVHGYGGTLAQFYQVFPSLLGDFNIYAIDLPGMGQSSKNGSITNLAYRIGIKLKSYQDALDFFIDSIEMWRIQLGIEKMILLGHSFGGYISAQYAAKYQTRVQLLILLSPAGTSTIDEEDIEKSRARVSTMPMIQQKMYKVAESIWNNRMTPQLLYQQWYGPVIMNQYLSERLKLGDEELELISDYSEGVLKIPEGSERGIYLLFDLKHFPKLQARVPIEVIYKENIFEFPICFFFGEKDWMDLSGAERMKSKFEKVHIFIVPKTGHQINVENPQYTSDSIRKCYQDFVR